MLSLPGGMTVVRVTVFAVEERCVRPTSPVPLVIRLFATSIVDIALRQGAGARPSASSSSPRDRSDGPPDSGRIRHVGFSCSATCTALLRHLHGWNGRKRCRRRHRADAAGTFVVVTTDLGAATSPLFVVIALEPSAPGN